MLVLNVLYKVPLVFPTSVAVRVYVVLGCRLYIQLDEYIMLPPAASSKLVNKLPFM